jgi:hypothetical protein
MATYPYCSKLKVGSLKLKVESLKVDSQMVDGWKEKAESSKWIA